MHVSPLFEPRAPRWFTPRSSLPCALLMGALLCLASVSRSWAEAPTIDVSGTFNTFLADEAFPAQYKRLLELEEQAQALIEDEPLKLGSIGAAILDIYPGSQTGHMVMQAYYEHLEVADAAAAHNQALTTLHAAMDASADGTPERPYRVMTVWDAQAYARHHGNSPVGSIYQSSKPAPFGYMLVTRPPEGKLRQVFFDLSHVSRSLLPPELPGSDEAHPQIDSPWPLIRLFATQSDTAAQTAIGAYLASADKLEEAVGWLLVASRPGNLLANTLLARIYWTQAEASEDAEEQTELRELSLENHLHAIALGSTESMYTLANLYLADYYGEENRISGVPLLEQAGDRGHVEALIYLGHLYSTGNTVDADSARAKEFYERAAALKDADAILRYGRYLTAGDHVVTDENHIVDWLTELARGASPEAAQAMVVLGNLHARSLVPKPSHRKAVGWYKRAVRKAPEDPDIVNEVAWTLTVTDVEGLQRARYARRIMNKLMDRNEDANARPEYLDTWAATYAANGEFPRAIELQNKAIDVARAQARDDVMDILTTHLEIFKRGETITERAP